MSIDDPQIERTVRTYSSTKGRVLNSILNDHTLSGADPAQIRDAITQARENTTPFDPAIDQLQMAIRAQRLKVSGSGI